MGEILTPKQEDAQKAIQELNAKKSFAEVARKYSANPDAKQTGGIDTHYTRLKDLEQAAPPVYAVIKDLKKVNTHPHHWQVMVYMRCLCERQTHG